MWELHELDAMARSAGTAVIWATTAAAALVVASAVGASRADDTPVPPPPAQCYQKLLYRICVGDDGQWHVDPVPALPIPGAPPAPPPPAS